MSASDVDKQGGCEAQPQRATGSHLSSLISHTQDGGGSGSGAEKNEDEEARPPRNAAKQEKQKQQEQKQKCECRKRNKTNGTLKDRFWKQTGQTENQ